MSKLIIQNLNNKEIVAEDFSLTLLQHIQQNGQDWMFACGGKGRCTTCRLHITEGMDKLSTLTIHEERYRQQARLKESERLTCQCKLHGEVKGYVPNPCKLPHIKYDF
jgi:2Fe-2S ferredoxin